MKLRNKKTGQIGNFTLNVDHFECISLDYVPEYRSLRELNEEWEDVIEEEDYYIIDSYDCAPEWCDGRNAELRDRRKALGNYFKTREEAQKARDKLEALQRLRDKGFKFKGWEESEDEKTGIRTQTILFHLSNYGWIYDAESDLDTLFGDDE